MRKIILKNEDWKHFTRHLEKIANFLESYLQSEQILGQTELGELEEHSPSKTYVAVNTLEKWQMHWDVVKYVFAFGLRERRGPYVELGAPVQNTKCFKTKLWWLFYHQRGGDDKWELQNCPRPKHLDTDNVCSTDDFFSPPNFRSAHVLFLSPFNFQMSMALPIRTRPSFSQSVSPIRKLP